MNEVSLNKLRTICLALPDTKETLTWGEPHFRVGEKIFCGCGEEEGRFVIGFKMAMDDAKAIVKMPSVWKAKYVGHAGWVTMDTEAFGDWKEIERLVTDSYRLIAPKRMVMTMDEVKSTSKSAVKRKKK